MDTGKGHFKPLGRKEAETQMKIDESAVFRVGEVFKIKGSRFRVEKILKKKMIMKLLPKIKTDNSLDPVDGLLADKLIEDMIKDREAVKQLGTQIGYGNMMQLASDLWKKDMIAKGYPVSGVFIPTLACDIKCMEQKIIQRQEPGK